MSIFTKLGLTIQKACDMTSSIRSIMDKNLSKKSWTHVIFMRWHKSYQEWCFDIPIVGIEDEPFVEGIPEIIEYHLGKSNKTSSAKKTGVTVLFSGAATKPKEFTNGNYFKLVKTKEENGGGWYKEPVSRYEGWLCPNLYQFFAKAPKQIHVCIRS